MIDEGVIQTWRTAARRGAAWLCRQALRPAHDGEPGSEITWFCKTPWALLVSGERDTAIALLRRCLADLVRADTLGAFAANESPHGTNTLAYALGWLVPAARIAEQYDAASRFYRVLNDYICHDTGGVLGCRGANAVQESGYDAALLAAGLQAALAMGELATARRIAALLGRLINEQPDPIRGFFMVFSPVDGHITEFDDNNRLVRVLLRNQERQPFANLGFALQALCRCAEATGESIHLTNAAAALDALLNEGHREDLLSHGQNHKVAHAAMLLYRHTRRPRYLDAAVRIANRTADRVGSDGRAWADVFHSDIAQQTPLLTIRTTCDSVAWLSQMADEALALDQLGAEKSKNT